MLGSVVFAVFSVQATPPKITYQDGSFHVSGALGSELVPVSNHGLPYTGPGIKHDRFKLTFGNKTVVFDSKGLSISQKGIIAVSRLNSVPTSGKIATKESNVELLKLVAEGKRTLNVAALSGWEQIGQDLFLLVRWEDKDKKPWLETLMKVNLASAKPRAQLVGRFRGLSFARGTVDDVLTLRSNKLSVLTNDDDQFGLSRMPADGSNVTFEALGGAVAKAKFSEDGSMAWTLTPTPYGTNILGIADLDYSTYHVVTEVRGKMTGVLAPAYARFKAVDGLKMVNLLTGAETPVTPDCGQCQTTNGLLVWSPAKNPQQASLLDPSFRRLAAWTAPPPTPRATTPVLKKTVVGAKKVTVRTPVSKKLVTAGATAKTPTKHAKGPVVTIERVPTKTKPVAHRAKTAPVKKG